MYQTAAKVIELDALVRKCNAWRVKGEHIVMTLGSFHTLGAGEIDRLEEARMNGHRMVIGFLPQGDESADADALRRMSALFAVDVVCVLGPATLADALTRVSPETLAMGIDQQVPIKLVNLPDRISVIEMA